MTRGEAAKILDAGGILHGGSWYWTKNYKNCDAGCCEDSFSSLEETLDSIETMCHWEEIST